MLDTNHILFCREAELKRRQANINAKLAKAGVRADTESEEESDQVCDSIYDIIYYTTSVCSSSDAFHSCQEFKRVFFISKCESRNCKS